jgi:Zn ribbon nucleic-acid-binding protein
MNLLNFVEQYPDEASCRVKFKEYRDQQGVVCPHCKSTQHYWKQDKECYECKKCGKRQSLRANTVMHGSQFKMIVINDLKSETITSLAENNVTKESTIDSDDSTSYVKLKDIVKEHRPQVIPKQEIGKVLPWVHIAISNAKRMLLDIYHDIKPEYLQNYLNEFCYKFNRRYFGENLFDRLMIASVTYKNQFR